MQTRVCRLYAKGDLRVESDPVAAPGPGEVLLKVGAGGICGSDLHYFQDGGFGAIRVREPMILGHEAAGTVAAVGERRRARAGGPGGDEPEPALRRLPLLPRGQLQQCRAMRFSGSAMRMPHEQGAFRDLIVVGAAQCVPVGRGQRSPRRPAPSRWRSCLHARSRAGDLPASGCW